MYSFLSVWLVWLISQLIAAGPGGSARLSALSLNGVSSGAFSSPVFLPVFFKLTLLFLFA